MTLKLEGVEFDYHTENTEQFTKDFIRFVTTDVPLFALLDELLYFMHTKHTTKFRIPDYRTADGRDHIFYFEVKKIEENSRIQVYHYLGVDLEIHKR